MTIEPQSLTTPELLQQYALILAELRAREIIRTANSPVGDYGEWLVANQLGLTLEPNSKSGYDAKDSFEVKYQIKSRRLTNLNQQIQLSVIRNLANNDFDYLIVVLFNELFDVLQVLKIPHQIIDRYAKFSDHVHGHILVLHRIILTDPLVEDITARFQI